MGESECDARVCVRGDVCLCVGVGVWVYVCVLTHAAARAIDSQFTRHLSSAGKSERRQE